MSEEYSGELALAQTTITQAKHTLKGSEKYRLNLAIRRVNALNQQLATVQRRGGNTKPIYRKLSNATVDLELLVLSIEEIL